MSSSLAAIRKMRTGDRPFILKSFLRSYRNGAAVKSVPNTIYYDVMGNVANQLLDSVPCYVAANPKNDNHIYGWVLVEADPLPVLHYVYVKGYFRRFGFGKQLLLAAGVNFDDGFAYTLRAPYTRALIQRYPQAIHNPFLLFAPRDN